MKILIVDDSKIIQDRVSSMIKEETEHEIIGQAYNGVDGKEMALKLKPDVVISDIRMPGGGGIELLTFIKNKKPEIKVIIVTNYAYTQYKERAKELGAEYFLSKAEDLDQLTKVLSEIHDSIPTNGKQ